MAVRNIIAISALLATSAFAEVVQIPDGQCLGAAGVGTNAVPTSNYWQFETYEGQNALSGTLADLNAVNKIYRCFSSAAACEAYRVTQWATFGFPTGIPVGTSGGGMLLLGLKQSACYHVY